MYSAATYTGNGIQTDFAVPFPYIAPAHVEVSVAALSVAFTWVNSGTVRITPAPPNGSTVIVRRNSNRVARLVDFTDGAIMDEATLDRDSNQLMYLVQESFDQVTTQSYFQTDANGARVTNVADPLVDSDAATKGWVQDYVASITADGNNLLPLDNQWTGINTFQNKWRIKSPGAVDNLEIDPGSIDTGHLAQLNRGLYVYHVTNHASAVGYGYATQVRRSSGTGLIVGAQIGAITMGNHNSLTFGGAFEAWKAGTSTGESIGLESSIVQTVHNDVEHARVGFDVVFKNREDNATVGGASPNILAQAGVGTGSNQYNANSWAIQVSSQSRSDSGATYVGWNRGFRFRNGWCDVAKPMTHNSARAYTGGDYVVSGGTNYIAVQDVPIGIAIGNTAYWSSLGPGTLNGPSGTINAIGIDFAGIDGTTAGRMAGAIRLRGDMPILWDTEGIIGTKFNPATGLWSITNAGLASTVFDVDVGSTLANKGDILVKGVRRVLGTRSTFSAHRNSAVFLLSPGSFFNVICGTEEFDDRGEYNASTGRFQPNTAGDYLITAQMQTENTAPAGASLWAVIYKNGAVYRGFNILTSAGINTACVNARVRMNGTTDFVEMRAFWTGASAVAISGEPSATFFQGHKLS